MVGDVLRPHRGAQLPGDDVARVIVENRGEIHPAPADDLEVGKICLPHLVGPGGLGMEAIRRLDPAAAGELTPDRTEQGEAGWLALLIQGFCIERAGVVVKPNF